VPEAGLPVVGGVDGEPGLAEAGGQGISEEFVIFDD
jgi:hypothetical protein